MGGASPYRGAGEGERSEQRSIRVAKELLASFHDGRIRFSYLGVKSYRMEVTDFNYEWTRSNRHRHAKRHPW
jgi:hypothetical protein